MPRPEYGGVIGAWLVIALAWFAIGVYYFTRPTPDRPATSADMAALAQSLDARSLSGACSCECRDGFAVGHRMQCSPNGSFTVFVAFGGVSMPTPDGRCDGWATDVAMHEKRDGRWLLNGGMKRNIAQLPPGESIFEYRDACSCSCPDGYEPWPCVSLDYRGVAGRQPEDLAAEREEAARWLCPQ